jgi:hypothetical protein
MKKEGSHHDRSKGLFLDSFFSSSFHFLQTTNYRVQALTKVQLLKEFKTKKNIKLEVSE